MPVSRSQSATNGELSVTQSSPTRDSLAKNGAEPTQSTSGHKDTASSSKNSSKKRKLDESSSELTSDVHNREG